MYKGYKIINEIAKGNSIVYKVCDDNNNIFAMKVINNKELYENEVNCLLNFNNEHIIKIIDNFKNSKEEYCIILEYCEDYIEFNKYVNTLKYEDLKIENVGIIFNKLCSTIKYIHEQGYSHRDLKMPNILINPNTLDFKIIDFGYTCEKNNIININVESHGYYDPNIKLKIIKENNLTFEDLIKGDLYSLGCIIFKTITCENISDMFINEFYSEIHLNSYELTNNEERNEFSKKIINRCKTYKNLGYENSIIENLIYSNFYNYNDPNCFLVDAGDVDEKLKTINSNINLHLLLSRNINDRTYFC